MATPPCNSESTPVESSRGSELSDSALNCLTWKLSWGQRFHHLNFLCAEVRLMIAMLNGKLKLGDRGRLIVDTAAHGHPAGTVYR